MAGAPGERARGRRPHGDDRRLRVPLAPRPRPAGPAAGDDPPAVAGGGPRSGGGDAGGGTAPERRSEEHTSELQPLMRNSYAVVCMKKTTTSRHKTIRRD